ncbi:hypothetical protein ACFV83_12465 [Streptomyces pharetrae]|uniref:hypothetical protein n=1 Tax=Streptomyces pharetrae TaxID=291370 RepID=UPI003660D560
MKRVSRIVAPLVAVGLLALGGWWLTGRAETPTLPESLCGTRIGPDLLRPLLPQDEAVTVDDDVDRERPRPSAWCVVYANGEEAIGLRYAWHSDPVDPLEIANSTSSVSQLELPQYVALPGARAVVGNTGAIATTSCRTSEGSYFTLSVLLEGVNVTADSYRSSLEDFMRAYFPATVKTLGCG